MISSPSMCGARRVNRRMSPSYLLTVVLSMQNNSSAAQQGYVTYNGYPLHTHAVVNPGATLTYFNHFENDGCTPSVASLSSYGMIRRRARPTRWGCLTPIRPAPSRTISALSRMAFTPTRSR